MGLRFRKRINLGAGFRINLSKSGVGYSWGVKGYRITEKATGGVRRTASLPGTGLSYVQEKGKNKKSPSQEQQTDPTMWNEHTSADISEITSANHKDFIEGINKVRMTRLFLLFLFPVGLVLQIMLWPSVLSAGLFRMCVGFTFLAGLIIIPLYFSKSRIPLEYDIEDDFEKVLTLREQALAALAGADKIWQETHWVDAEKKTSGGASTTVKKNEAKLGKAKLPSILNNSDKFYRLKLNKKELYFLPDKILVVGGLKVGAIDYSELNIKVQDTIFIVERSEAKDSELLGYTWLKVNKDGSPDKRFASNRQMLQFRYGELTWTTPKGFNIKLLTSNYGKAKVFESYYREMLWELNL